MRPPEMRFEMFAAASRTDADRDARWAAAVAAVATTCPELVGAPGDVLRDARVLRIAFGAIDVFVFPASFAALFDGMAVPIWGWRLSDEDAPLDAWTEVEEVEGSGDADDGWQMEPTVIVEFVLHRGRLAAAFPAGTPGPERFDDHAASSVIDALVGALGRRMIRHVARHGTPDTAEVDGLERQLLAAFGDGPRVAAVGPLGPNPGTRSLGPREAGPRDAGPRDAGPRDAGPRDAGPRDAGPRDAGRSLGPRGAPNAGDGERGPRCPDGAASP